ncbi:hypothetical protein D3C81_879000 [compost metagenome]
MIDIEVEVLGDSKTATAMRAITSIAKLVDRPQATVASAHNEQVMASRRVRDRRSAKRPAGRPSST